MAPVDLNNHGDAQLEAGLLRTQEEEKIPFISPGLDQTRTGPEQRQLDPKESRKMSSLKRLAMMLMLSVLVGFGLAMAKDSSLSTSCIGWARGNQNMHPRAARSFLAKRADASVTNATTPGSAANPEQVSSSTPPVTSTTSSSRMY